MDSQIHNPDIQRRPASPVRRPSQKGRATVMSMMIVPIPLFDAKMAVESYWLYSQDGKRMLGVKDNFLRLDGAFSHPALEAVERIGLEPFAGDKRLFVPITTMQLMSGLLDRCKVGPKHLVCVLSPGCVSDPEAIREIYKLYGAGYQIALMGYPEQGADSPAMGCVDFVILDYTDPRFAGWYIQARQLPDTKPVIYNVPDMDVFNALKADCDAYFTGSFYSRPVTKGKAQLSPIKVNAMHLLANINDDDFELEDIVATIERDPYLSVSLLRYLNSTAAGLSRQVESIQQAVTILGQNAVRQWAAVALSTTLGQDRPSEITKLALVRAKFAEDIASAFNLGVFQSALFMCGLFSLLDVMLEKPMEEAIKEVAVSKLVRVALLEKQGPLAPVMELIYAYERADWDKASILMIQNHTDMEHISQAYLDALIWYRKLLQSIDRDTSPQQAPYLGEAAAEGGV